MDAVQALTATESIVALTPTVLMDRVVANTGRCATRVNALHLIVTTSVREIPMELVESVKRMDVPAVRAVRTVNAALHSVLTGLVELTDVENRAVCVRGVQSVCAVAVTTCLLR